VLFWEKISESYLDLPDVVKKDMDAAIGQAKLLIRYKLPQFGQLLGQYLSPATDVDTPAVLEGDLEGWWAVADIEVKTITNRIQYVHI